MSYKTALIIVILATAAFILYIWQFGFPELEDELPQELSSTLREPDALTPAAGICDFYEGPAITFELQDGIPNPRCARLLPGQLITFMNQNSETISFEFAERPYSIEPGANITNGRRVEQYLMPGVHVVAMDFYGGSGPEIWVQDSRTFEIDGTVRQQFASARAFVLQTSSGELTLSITDNTRILLSDGSPVSPDQFSLHLTANTDVTVVAHLEEAETGTALEVRVNSDEVVACTLDAKICPDGTAVGRVGPNCEFAPCPVE